MNLTNDRQSTDSWFLCGSFLIPFKVFGHFPNNSNISCSFEVPPKPAYGKTTLDPVVQYIPNLLGLGHYTAFGIVQPNGYSNVERYDSVFG